MYIIEEYDLVPSIFIYLLLLFERCNFVPHLHYETAAFLLLKN